ncbi:MAG: ubiquinol-cytochrome C chaperone family protein [Caulobacteraceae bacterium]
MFERWFAPRPAVAAGRALFKSLAAQARQPGLYVQAGVADTVEGRFELYVLHLVLLLHRLKGEGLQAGETAQAVFDSFLKNLDEGLRDMGVGDLSVGKKMRKLGEAVYGRIKSYDRALEPGAGADDLTGVIQRTVFEGQSDAPGAGVIAAYVRRVEAALATQPLSDILEARLHWPAFEEA